jgi:4-amino-4-deoxy-L-arabinose transferase-like glycosyltransferase
MRSLRGCAAEPLLLWGIVSGGFFLRLVALLRGTCIELDGISYATMGHQLVRGEFSAVLRNVFPPMYPVFIGVVHLIIPDVEVAGRFASLFLGTILIVFAYFFVKRMSGNGEKGLWAAFLVAVQPYLIRYSGQVLSESTATLLFTCTAFVFYIGWQENNRKLVAIAGLFLCLTYLTRPEYVAFYAPLGLLLLLRDKRFASLGWLLLPFLVLGSLYVLYLHFQTGMWIVSNKATLSPFVRLWTFVFNFPLVIYEFLVAQSPWMILLAVLGFRRVPVQYRVLLISLILFHVFSLSTVGHATKRYSVEFIPLVVVLAVDGIELLTGCFSKSLKKMTASLLVITVVLGFCLTFVFTESRSDRVLHKQAGLFLLAYAPGSRIVCRLPIVAFYAKGQALDLVSVFSRDDDIRRLRSILVDRKPTFLLVDNETERDFPLVKEYTAKRVPIREFAEKEDSLSVYRVTAE